LVVVGCVAGGFFWYIRKRRRATHDMDAWLDKAETNAQDNEKETRRATDATAAHESVVRSFIQCGGGSNYRLENLHIGLLLQRQCLMLPTSFLSDIFLHHYGTQ
jgi:hypothetical protein